MCFTTIDVPSNSRTQTVVTTIGQGQIYLTSDISNDTEQVVITCPPKAPNCMQTIQASLPFGGYMLIYLEPSPLYLVSWEPTTFALSSSDPYSLFIPLNRYS